MVSRRHFQIMGRIFIKNFVVSTNIVVYLLVNMFQVMFHMSPLPPLLLISFDGDNTGSGNVSCQQPSRLPPPKLIDVDHKSSYYLL